MKIGDILDRNNVASKALLIGAGGVCSAAGGALGVWAFTTLPPLVGAQAGLAALIASAISGIAIQTLGKTWPENSLLKELPNAVKNTALFVILQRCGVHSFKSLLGVGLVSIITEMALGTLAFATCWAVERSAAAPSPSKSTSRYCSPTLDFQTSNRRKP